MKKLNNKGYMLIEIILASVITFAIAFSLINLIIKLKNTNEDLYNETNILNDKISITKNIMDDIKDYDLITINNDVIDGVRTISLELEDENGNQIKKKILISNNVIEYGTDENGSIKKKDKSYYKKEIKNSTEIGNITAEESTGTLSLKIPISSIYSKKKYDVMILFKVKNKPEYPTIKEVEADTGIWTTENKTNIKKIEISPDINTSELGEAINISTSSEEDKTINAYVKEDTIYIKIKEKIKANPNSKDLFNGFENLETINGIEYIDTSEVTNMNSMFKNLKNITELDLCKFNTKKVTNMDGMFEGTEKLTKIYVGTNWQTSTSITNMFEGSATNTLITGECS